MRITPPLCIVVVALFSTTLFAAAKTSSRLPEKERIAAWAALLPESPRCVGPTIEDRAAWDAAASSPGFRRSLNSAQKLLAEPAPEIPDDLYLDFSRTGNRRRYEQVASRQFSRLSTLVLAECLENRGRFLSAVNEIILTHCNAKSWTLPAHDSSLTTFHGTAIFVDLQASRIAWELATADAWLGDRLPSATRQRIRAELERRVFQPIEQWLNDENPRQSWMTGENNWNAVCLAGVTGAALTAIESRERRALFAATAEKYIAYYLAGFTPNGYCSEGVSYWNYGFGHFILLAETLKQATDGKIDWMQRDQVKTIARYASRVEIEPGVFPAFADCHPGAQPALYIMAMLSRRFEWGLKDIENRGLGPQTPFARLFETAVYCFPNSLSKIPTAKTSQTSPALRDWFADAQVLICRPRSGVCGLGAAMKAGHNAEQHNHNDVGSYTVAIQGKTPLLDPGGEIYTRRTFSRDRYQSNVLNSFGHGVPRVAGQLQQTGRKAAARVLKTDFTEKRDTYVLDLSAAYDVPSLQRLERTFVYAREGRGSLDITDVVEFKTPQSFGGALITFDAWKRLDAHRLQIGDGASAVIATIAVEGGEWRIAPEEIHEDLSGGRTPTRIGIELTKPTTSASIAIHIAPKDAI